MNKINDWTANSQQMIRSQINSTMSKSSIINPAKPRRAVEWRRGKLKVRMGRDPQRNSIPLCWRFGHYLGDDSLCRPVGGERQRRLWSEPVLYTNWPADGPGRAATASPDHRSHARAASPRVPIGWRARSAAPADSTVHPYVTARCTRALGATSGNRDTRITIRTTYYNQDHVLQSGPGITIRTTYSNQDHVFWSFGTCYALGNSYIKKGRCRFINKKCQVRHTYSNRSYW